MTTLITNIGQLVNVRETREVLRGKALAELPELHHAYLLIDDDVIAAYGPMKSMPYSARNFNHHYDAGGRFVMPSWCDSHTHLVFAGSRKRNLLLKSKA
jgi:imidazolonepropionase